MRKRQELLIPAERIERSILLLRGQNAMLDADLAALYEVETKVLNQAVSRNRERFPDDFMFRLTAKEFDILRSQSVTSSSWGGRRYRPRAFTEQGVAMLSSVLNSPRAVAVNIDIMRRSNCAVAMKCVPDAIIRHDATKNRKPRDKRGLRPIVANPAQS